MGVIRIAVEGSFRPNTGMTLSAQNNGHAAAVRKTVEWLQKEVLPGAEALDSRLDSEGVVPAGGWLEEDLARMRADVEKTSSPD